MSRRVLAVLVLVLLTLTGCTEVDPDDGRDPTASSTALSARGSPSEEATSRTQPDRPTTRESAPPETARSANGSVGDALEMPAASPTEAVLADLLPGRRDRPLLARPIPGRAQARGRLVHAFPDYLRPVRRSTTVSSSLSPDGARLQVALEAVTELGTDAVLREYRRRLGRLRMREVVVATAGGSEAMAMRRGHSSLVVTVTLEGDRTAYTIYGTLVAGA